MVGEAMEDHFWLSNMQFSRIQPLLPNKVRGVPRVDDRRIISGIIHVLSSDCPWHHAPPLYGPYKTLYNRFVRWAEKGIWVPVFQQLSQDGGPSLRLMLGSTAITPHHGSMGRKGRKWVQLPKKGMMG